MDESRFRTANVHHIYPRNPEGFECLCGAVMGKHRDCTEHIIDMYRADLRTKVEGLPHEDGCNSILEASGAGRCDCLIRDVLALIGGDTQ